MTMATTATAVPRPKVVSGVKMEHVSEETVARAYEQAFKRGANGPVEAQVKELAEFFAKHSGKALLECTVCEGALPTDMDSCPYCGDDDTSLDSEPPVPSAALARTNGHANGHANGAALAPISKPLLAGGNQPVIAENADLDNALGQIRRLKVDTGLNYWRLGRILLEVHDKQLWKQRNREDGKPLYGSYKKWVAQEAEIDPRSAYAMKQIATEFTEKMATRWGASILKELLAAPSEDRVSLLTRMDKAGVEPTLRGVRDEARVLRDRKQVKMLQGAAAVPEHTKIATLASQAKAEVRRKEKERIVTVALPQARVVLDLFAKKAKKGDPDRPAKRVSDEPWAQLECSNGVLLRARLLVGKTGQLQVVLEAQRAS